MLRSIYGNSWIGDVDYGKEKRRTAILACWHYCQYSWIGVVAYFVNWLDYIFLCVNDTNYGEIMKTKNVNGLAIAGFIGGLLCAFVCNCADPLVQILFRRWVPSSPVVWILASTINLTIQPVFLMLACFGFAQSDKYVKGLKSLGICGIILNLLAIISSPIVSYGIARLYYHFFK